MEQIEITKTEGEFRIEGFPDAVKMIKLEEPESKRLADLSLHISDFEFALACLKDINSVPDSRYVIRQALWRSAVVHYMKCFGGSKSRFRLVAQKVYKGNPTAIELYKYFASLRNKHLVHDENSLAQCLPGAVLNKNGMDHKIAKIVCMEVIADTLEQSNYNNLHNLITLAKQWAITQFDRLTNEVTRKLELEKYETLLAREGIVYTAPKVAEIHDVRYSK